jgi:hypothetical protein
VHQGPRGGRRHGSGQRVLSKVQSVSPIGSRGVMLRLGAFAMIYFIVLGAAMLFQHDRLRWVTPSEPAVLGMPWASPLDHLHQEQDSSGQVETLRLGVCEDRKGEPNRGSCGLW